MSQKSNLQSYSKKKKTKTIKNSDISSKKSKQTSKNINIQTNINNFWQKYSVFLFLAVGIITFFVFKNAISNDFLNWDDDRYVTGNKYLNFSTANIKYFFTDFYFVMYIPLTMLSYMFDYNVFGLSSPWAFHLHSIILHIGVTLLIFIFIKKLFDKKGNEKYIYATFVALLFGIHPLHVESVTWIAERKDVLYSLFFMASLIFYVDYCRKSKKINILLSFLFFGLSLLSKTQAVVLPLMLIIIDYYLRNFIEDKKSLVAFLTLKDKQQRKIFIEKIPFLILSIFFGYLAIKASATNEPFAENYDTNTRIATDTGYGIIEKLALISYSLLLYLVKLLFPFKQSAIHPYPFNSGQMPTFFIIYSITPILFVASVIWAWLKKKKEIALGLLFFILNIFIVLHIKNFIISEHYAYLPAIGFSIFLIYLLLSFVHKNNKLSYIILIITLIYVSLLSFKTVERNKVFDNSLTFWDDVLEKYPKVVVGYYNRANFLQELGDKTLVQSASQSKRYYQAAIVDYNKNIELSATNVGAYSNRGVTYAKMGDYDKALSDFNSVIKIDSTYGNVYSNRGNTLGLLGKWNEAIADYNVALSFNPNFTDALYNRALAYMNSGRDSASLNDLNKVLELEPQRYEAYTQRGIIYINFNEYDKAITDFNTYIKVNNTDYNTIYHRGIAFSKKGDEQSAMQDFQWLKNNYPGIITNLVNIAQSYENSGDATRNPVYFKRAIELYKNIIKIDDRNSNAYSTIGVLKAKLGNLDSAFINFNKAIELDSNNSQAFVNRGYAYYLTNRKNLAMRDYNKAISSPNPGHSAFLNRGILNETLKKYNAALADYDMAISLKQDYGYAYYRRGVLYFNTNRREKACNDFHFAAQLGIQEAINYQNKYCN